MPIDPNKIVNRGKIPITDAFRQTIADRPDLVTVIFDGLGISTFKDLEKQPDGFQTGVKTPLSGLRSAIGKKTALTTKTPFRNETAIIRKANHDLSFKIYGMDASGVWQETSLFSDSNLPNDVEISIKAISNPQIDGYRKYQSAGLQTLSRASVQDAHDLRCLIDIEGTGFHEKKLKAKKGKNKLSKLFIQNAEFYCDGLLTKGPNDPTPQPQVVVNPALTDPAQHNQVFNYIGRSLGAKIEAAQVEVKITGSGVDASIVLDKTSPANESRFLVHISNTCDNRAGGGDFGAVYDFLTDPLETVITLDAQPPLPSPAKPIVIPPKDNKPLPMSHVRFCGAYLASKQSGIGEIIDAQSLSLPPPSQ